MAYDGANVILFGGGLNGSVLFGDTWRWNGAAGQWQQLAPPTRPSPRSGSAMVYDPVRQTIVLFGGKNATPPYNQLDTWEWSRASGTWTQQIIGAPAASFSTFAGAFDVARSRVTIYIRGVNPPLWTRDSVGSAPWTAVPTTFTPPDATGLTYDSARNRLILVGIPAYFSSQYGPLTWEMPPGPPAWELRSSATPPGYHYYPRIVFDAARARTLLFGSGQTWEWDGLSSGPAVTSIPSEVWANHGEVLSITVGAAGPGLSYQWRRGQQPLSNVRPFSGVTTPTLTVAPASIQQMDRYSAAVTNACGTVVSPYVQLGVTCPLNCDGSIGTPVLNANDFQCFIELYGSGSSLANCDGSTGVPFLTANDFMCFLNRVAAQDCSPW